MDSLCKRAEIKQLYRRKRWIFVGEPSNLPQLRADRQVRLSPLFFPFTFFSTSSHHRPHYSYSLSLSTGSSVEVVGRVSQGPNGAIELADVNITILGEADSVRSNVIQEL